jgi:hypothetical protein
VAALAGALSTNTTLVSLDLCEVGAGDQAVAALAGVGDRLALTHLDLSRNPNITLTGMRALAKAVAAFPDMWGRLRSVAGLAEEGKTAAVHVAQHMEQEVSAAVDRAQEKLRGGEWWEEVFGPCAKRVLRYGITMVCELIAAFMMNQFKAVSWFCVSSRHRDPDCSVCRFTYGVFFACCTLVVWLLALISLCGAYVFFYLPVAIFNVPGVLPGAVCILLQAWRRRKLQQVQATHQATQAMLHRLQFEWPHDG